MKKQEFITRLHYKLSGIPETDVLERLGFIGEMIDDRIEEGYTEDDAVRAVGSVDDVAARIIEEVGGRKAGSKGAGGYAHESKGKISALAITLIILGSPIWISLGAAFFVLIVAAYAVIWSIVGSLWAVFGSLVGAGAGGALASLLFVFTGSFAAGSALFGASLLSLGLSVPAFYGCIYTTKGAAWLSKQIAIGIKNIFVRR